METARSEELERVLQEYGEQKRLYAEIVEEWEKKEEWLNSLPDFQHIFAFALIGVGIDLRDSNKLDRQKADQEDRRDSARRDVSKKLAFEPGIYELDSIHFHPHRRPGTLVTIFTADLDGETFEARTKSSIISIEHCSVETYKVEIKASHHPILHVPYAGNINVTKHKANEPQEQVTIDLSGRTEISVYPDGGLR